MGKLALLVLLGVVAVGLGYIGNYASRLAIRECEAECPKNQDALKTVYAIGPFYLQVCECGKMDTRAHGEQF